MSVAIEQTAAATVLRLEGDLDMGTMSASMGKFLEVSAEPPPHLTIDASGVTFLDSTGVGALVMVAMAVREGGGVVTCHPSVQMNRLLSICGIGRLLGVPGTVG